jgi:hypothetical protein
MTQLQLEMAESDPTREIRPNPNPTRSDFKKKIKLTRPEPDLTLQSNQNLSKI